MQVEEVIKNVMIEKNLGQEQFAGILGVNQTNVSQWLSGKKKPSYESILMLYKKFDIQPNLLFGIKYKIVACANCASRFNFNFKLFKFGEVLNCSYHLRGVRIFVVVPAYYLYERGAVTEGHALCLGGVEE